MTCADDGCDYQLDLDGQVTCTNCGAMDDELNKHVQNKELDRVIAHDEIYKGRVARDKRNYPVMTHDEPIAEIKTQAGLEMFKYFNDNYGSSIWGRVLRGIQAIEKELE